MCGICGLASLDADSQPDPAALTRMNETLVHRGPDSDGQVIEGPVGLAAKRLSIIDLEHGDQPISNEDGSVHVVLNGEIYNHDQLREDLRRRGHSFRTSADTEVLVHLYEERGALLSSELRGMFAFAIWDSKRGRLVLSRDRFGIKPLYYRLAGGWLSFGSELKALMRQPGFDAEVDLRALEAYLAFNSIPGPLTIFSDTHKLLPGHTLVWEGGGIVLERWARPAPVAAESERSEGRGALAEELRERLRDSVRAHLIADVPVGVLLSGGIDSSGLVAIAAEESSEPVRTFSIGFEESSFNELDRARLVAERYETDHHELVVRPDAVELLPSIVDAFDEPFADSSALPTYLVSKLAAQSVKVALSGEGGDELFGGYYTYVADLLADRLGGPARLARPLIERLPTSSSKVSFDYKAKRFAAAAHLPPLERHHGWKEIFSADARTELLRPEARAPGFDPFDVYRRRHQETSGSDRLARLQDVDLGIYLVDDLLVKTDRASMAHSLEARVPFLDPAVTDLALALPRRQKVSGMRKKVLLRRALAPLLPREIVRARKQGFSAPVGAWLRGPLSGFAREVLSSQRLLGQGYFEPAAAGRLLDDHISGRRDLSRQIWGLLCFSLWLERQAGPRQAPPAAIGGLAGG